MSKIPLSGWHDLIAGALCEGRRREESTKWRGTQGELSWKSNTKRKFIAGAIATNYALFFVETDSCRINDRTVASKTGCITRTGSLSLEKVKVQGLVVIGSTSGLPTRRQHLTVHSWLLWFLRLESVIHYSTTFSHTFWTFLSTIVNAISSRYESVEKINRLFWSDILFDVVARRFGFVQVIF